MEVGALRWLRWRTSCIAAAQLAQGFSPPVGASGLYHHWGSTSSVCFFVFLLVSIVFLPNRTSPPIAMALSLRGCIPLLKGYELRG